MLPLNNTLQVILYQNIFKNYKAIQYKGFLSDFKSNIWTKNFRDTIITKNHYHSNTNGLRIELGKVDLKIGGPKEGKSNRFKSWIRLNFAPGPFKFV